MLPVLIVSGGYFLQAISPLFSSPYMICDPSIKYQRVVYCFGELFSSVVFLVSTIASTLSLALPLASLGLPAFVCCLLVSLIGSYSFIDGYVVYQLLV